MELKTLSTTPNVKGVLPPWGAHRSVLRHSSIIFLVFRCRFSPIKKHELLEGTETYMKKEEKSGVDRGEPRPLRTIIGFSPDLPWAPHLRGVTSMFLIN